MPSDFRHVSDLLLRRILATRPERLTMRDVQGAVSRTLDALGRDTIRDDVPASAFEARREAARKATKLMREHRKAQAHRALVKFWLS
jgi:hypothetical protein